MNLPFPAGFFPLPGLPAGPATGTTPTRVSLVGAGPGDPELLTLRALDRLRRAEVVCYDHLVSTDILQLAAQAQQVCVGKRAGRHSLSQEGIHQLLIGYARAGLRVVRLKGGDPLLFGRGGEEMLALHAAGIDYEVVPGISAALGAAAMADLPLTHRDYAQGCTLVTGHRRADASHLAWIRHTHAESTVVVYMGLNEASAISAGLMAHGRAADTPVAVIEHATTPRQRVTRARLDQLAQVIAERDITPPALLVIGAVVAVHDVLQAAWAGHAGCASG